MADKTVAELEGELAEERRLFDAQGVAQAAQDVAMSAKVDACERWGQCRLRRDIRADLAAARAAEDDDPHYRTASRAVVYVHERIDNRYSWEIRYPEGGDTATYPSPTIYPTRAEAARELCRYALEARMGEWCRMIPDEVAEWVAGRGASTEPEPGGLGNPLPRYLTDSGVLLFCQLQPMSGSYVIMQLQCDGHAFARVGAPYGAAEAACRALAALAKEHGWALVGATPEPVEARCYRDGDSIMLVVRKPGYNDRHADLWAVCSSRKHHISWATSWASRESAQAELDAMAEREGWQPVEDGP